MSRGLCGSTVGIRKDNPGSKSGLSSKGVMGPGVGFSWSGLHAALKFRSVALMSECSLISFEILFGLIQGRRCSGIGVNAFSI